MKECPKVSVIVPVYGVEKFINACVDSILTQSFVDFELILVDDGSPDNCGSVCDEYAAKDPRVKVIHKENGGVSSARNAGLDSARGEYIAFCDGDDSWEETFLAVLVSAADQGQRDLVSCALRYVFNGRTGWEMRVAPALHELPNCEEKMQYMHGTLLQGKEGWEACTRLFRTDIIRKNQIQFCTSCRNFAEDLGFVAQYVLFAKSICVVDECLYNYNVREGSMMRTSRELIRLDELNEVSRAIGLHYSEERLGKAWKKYRAVMHYMVMYNQLSKVIQQERLPQLRFLLADIKDQKWFRENMAGIFGAYGILKACVGSKDAHRILLLSGFCLHRTWWLYRASRGLYNKLFGYRQE